MNRLSAGTLADVTGADIPTYDRRLPPSIVHLGVGAFARAHLATYADDLLRAGEPATIHGVSLRSPRAEELLQPQDGLFTITTRELDAPPSTRVVGSLTSVATGPPAAVEAIARPETQLVTLTVTEKAYDDDLADLLVAALRQRRDNQAGPVAVASLDNLLDNGAILADLVHRAAEEDDSSLAVWIDANVAFPRSVVDRIVPATTHDAVTEVAGRTGIVDEAAIITEHHRSWIIEGVGGLPPLGEAGVEVVADVGPYQQRKLWLLNGPHSVLAYAGLLSGHATIADAVGDPTLLRFVRSFVEDVIAVGDLDGLDAGAFAGESLRRFANPLLGHTCVQVAADGSRKLAQRLIPVMARRSAAGLPTDRFELVLAAWLVVATHTPVRGQAVAAIDDPSGEVARAALAADGPAGAIVEVFGEDAHPHADGVAGAFAHLVREGVGAVEEQA